MGPVTGGTAYAIQLPATMTAGFARMATPATVNGWNTSQLTSALINVNDLTGLYIAGGGTAQAQTATLSPAATALSTGLHVYWKPAAANSAAAPTLAVNGLTATTITKCGTTALVANDLTTTAVAHVIYDGTQYQLLNPQAAGCGASGGGLPTGTTGQGVYYASGGTTGTATSAVLVDSATTTGVIQFGGVETHIATGPTSATTTSGSTTNVATTLTVVSTTGYPSCSTQTPCYLVLGSNNFVGEIVSCTAIGSSTTFTGCSRNLFGSTAANPLATASSVDLVARLYADAATSTFYHYLSIWNGPDFYNGTGNITIGATLQGSNAGSYFIGGSNQTTNFSLLGWGVGNGALRAGDGGTKFQNGATAVIGELDQDGILSQLAGTLSVTAGTTSITPVTGVVVLTGTVPTSGTLLSMAVPSGACTVANQSCHLTIINTTTASLTTGSGTAAGNFALAYTLPLKGEMICNAYGATALWYCTR
jgi:hypothetical protein